MSHLNPESLARLVDEDPDTEEASHLAECARCRDALGDLRAQTAALRALPAMSPPADAWERIAARVEAERVVPVRRSWPAGAIRAVAAVTIFALGAATGTALSRGSGAAPSVTANEAGRGAPATTTVTQTTPDLALMRLRIAELMYTSALLDYASITSPLPPKDAVARLATLETIVLTTRTALERAPADPLINSYHLAALAERETLLGQLRRTSESEQWY
jgi:hypothetical protein